MSNKLAIAAVTTTLQNILRSEISNNGIAGFEISTLPLDKANNDNDGKDRLNIFLYQTEVNPAFRNMDISRFKENSRPPLPLNLYYLITAYGKDRNRMNDHRILGHAMRILHDHTQFSRKELEKIYPDSQLHQQFEQVRITPQPTSVDEMSKLWTTFQTQYRISAAYQVSVVLIDSEEPGPSALPVLQRGRGTEDCGAYVLAEEAPYIHNIKISNNKSSAEPGDFVILHGSRLNTKGLKVRFRNKFWEKPQYLTPVSGATSNKLIVKWPDANAVPNIAKDWPVAPYSIALLVKSEDGLEWSSNSLPIALAPQITITQPPPPDGHPEDSPKVKEGKVNIILDCFPEVRKQQAVALIFGKHIVSPDQPISADSATLKFSLDNVKEGIYVVRLRVDGIDSIPIRFSGDKSPEFDSEQTIIVEK